jgi:hypothetical protein
MGWEFTTDRWVAAKEKWKETTLSKARYSDNDDAAFG